LKPGIIPAAIAAGEIGCRYSVSRKFRNIFVASSGCSQAA
jgi:adenine/guanine phosphoribosyltransferase-like PRPP-binding protein